MIHFSTLFILFITMRLLCEGCTGVATGSCACLVSDRLRSPSVAAEVICEQLFALRCVEGDVIAAAVSGLLLASGLLATQISNPNGTACNVVFTHFSP